jgi:hypothetical protein
LKTFVNTNKDGTFILLLVACRQVPECILTQNSVGVGGVSYIDARKKFWNTIPACILLRKNFQTGVPACSVTKIPLLVGIQMVTNFDEIE